MEKYLQGSEPGQSEPTVSRQQGHKGWQKPGKENSILAAVYFYFSSQQLWNNRETKHQITDITDITDKVTKSTVMQWTDEHDTRTYIIPFATTFILKHRKFHVIPLIDILINLNQ